MNFKKIMTTFFICLPVCIAARVVQIAVTIQKSNGFYLTGFDTFGNVMMALIGLSCVLLFLVAFKAYKTPEKTPRVNLAMAITSYVVALAFLGELFFEAVAPTTPEWQKYVAKVITVAASGYFVLFGSSHFCKIKMPRLIHAIPAIYAIARTIFTFINISSLAAISDNVLLMAGYCVLMLFFINYGKLYNGLDVEVNFRKILATGLVSVTLCASQSVAYLLVNVFGSGYTHSDSSVIFTLLAMSVFIVVFILAHFKTNKKEYI
ncbi:MAG: hypothetical protein E7542_04970 [Ruminococcaceae bacterium]|nr:hypothetical protein [Oscillospiraceae bacterium]